MLNKWECLTLCSIAAMWLLVGEVQMMVLIGLVIIATLVD